MLVHALPLFAQISGLPGLESIARETRPRVTSRAGNSVDTATGAFLVEQNVLSVHGGRDLDFTLTYNSLFTGASGMLGAGWSHNFEARLESSSDLRLVYWGPVARNVFRATNPLATEFTPLDESAQYDRLTASGTPRTYRLVRQDGTRYVFDAEGRLTETANKNNQRIEIVRNESGQMTELREPLSGRRITLTYAKDRPSQLQAAADGADRVVHFEYNAAGRLNAVRNPVVFGTIQSPITVQAPIPDNNQAGVSLAIRAPDTGLVGLVRLVSIGLIHPRPSDLRVFLISPSGRRAELPRPAAGSNTNAASYGGTIIGAFEGEASGGIWNVQVADTVPGMNGALDGASLQFSGPAYPTYLTYDGEGRMLSAVDSLNARLFANNFDAFGRVATQDDGIDTNLSASFTYEESPGRVVTTYRDRAGGSQTYEHDGQYRLLRFEDATGNSTARTYDSRGDCVSYTDPLGRRLTFDYDNAGNLIRAVDAASAATTYSYDGQRNLTEIVDPLGHRTQFTYNGSNNLTAVSDALGNRDTKPYNGNGQIAGILMADGGGITYSYANGMLSSASHPAGGGSARTAYDDAGRLIRMTDPDGFATNLDYDPRGNIIRRTDALGRTREFYYDERNRQVRLIEPSGATTFYSYDGNDNIVAVTDPLGRVIRYGYDMEDRRTTITNPAGAIAISEYDAAGRLVSESDAAGNALTYQYDPAGNRVATLNGDGEVIERITYDVRDNPIETIDAYGNRSRARYDLAGRLVESRNALDEVIQVELDNLDRPIEARDPLGRTLRRTYESDDVVRSQVDGAGGQNRFFYDQANRLTGYESFFGSARFTYNGRDLLTSARTPLGRTTTFTYDSAGQLTRIARTATAAGVANSGENISFTYDVDGRPIETVRAASAGASTLRLRRTWDLAGRLVQYTDDAGQTVGYTYDSAGNVAEIRYPDGSRVHYTYDLARRMNSVTDWAGRVTQFEWTRDGLLSVVRFPNGAVRRIEYDSAGRPRRRTEYSASGEAIQSIGYSHDAGGRLSAEELGGGVTGPASLPATFAAQVSNDNRFSTVNGQPAAYDQDGNLTQGLFGGRMASLRYDAGGRLISSGDSDYTYDAEDRLVSIRSATGTTRLTYNPLARLSQVLVETGPAGTTRYVHGVGLLYGERNGQIFVHHFDQRGSTIGFTGPGGQITGRLMYTPYGQIVERSGETNSLFLFNGLFGVVTVAEGLLWMRYRWYSPDLHRFLTVDARLGDITEPASLNRYAFVGNNPSLRIDPDGEFWWVAVGALVGSVANVAVQVASDVVSGKVSDWKTYAGAAVSGAVVGAGVALCPACGVAGTALLGAAATAAGYAVEKGLRGERVDAGELALEATVGGLAGGVGAGGGRLASKAVGKFGSKLGPKFMGKLGPSGKVLARRAVNGRLGIAKHALQQEFRRGLVRGALQGGFTRAAEESGLGLAIETGVTNAGGFVAGIFNGAAIAAASAPRVRHDIEAEAPRLLNRNGKALYGEHAQWQAFLDYMTLAGRPLPADANHFLTAF